MKKYNAYKVYKNGQYVEGFQYRCDAEAAIRQYRHEDFLSSIHNCTAVPCNSYEIRR